MTDTNDLHETLQSQESQLAGLDPLAYSLSSLRSLNSELSDQGGTWIRATGCESSAPTARPSCLPQGVGEEEKKERGLTERRKGFPFPLPFLPSPSPSPSPFAHAAQATTAYICLILSPQ